MSGVKGSYHGNTVYRLEDYQLLKDAGESFERIAARFGIKPDSLQAWFERHGLEP